VVEFDFLFISQHICAAMLSGATGYISIEATGLRVNFLQSLSLNCHLEINLCLKEPFIAKSTSLNIKS